LGSSQHSLRPPSCILGSLTYKGREGRRKGEEREKEGRGKKERKMEG